jgi:glycosyltransferase involved in cell wall biosynthesis
VIIITKDEEEDIKDCIESVIKAINYALKKRKFATAEIILVDSASEDRTVEIAKKFPIKILKMPSNWKVSAGAGRYFGMKNAKGKYISMVDGDTRIRKEWYTIAFPTLKKHTKAAGVCGHYLEKKIGNSVTENVIKNAELSYKTGEIDTISVGLFKRKAIDSIGSYNPHLIAAEDKEFAKRGLYKGYKFIRIDTVEGEHYLSSEHKPYTFIDNMKRDIWYGRGEGQAARFHRDIGEKKLFWLFSRYYFNYNFARVYLLFCLYVLIVGLNFLAVFLNDLFPYLLILMVIVDIFMITLWILAKTNRYAFKIVLLGSKFLPDFRVSSNYKVLLFNLSGITYALTRQFGYFWGFIPRPKLIQTYPKNIEEIQTGEVLSRPEHI